MKIIPASRILALTAARVARQVPSYEQEARVARQVPSHEQEAREFIGCDWFEALFEQEVNPVIRLKRDTSCNTRYRMTIQHRGIKAPADAWFSQLKPGEILELTKARVMGVRVFVVATLTPEGEFLILATRKRPSQALVIYAQRWEREQPASAASPSGAGVAARSAASDPSPIGAGLGSRSPSGAGVAARRCMVGIKTGADVGPID